MSSSPMNKSINVERRTWDKASYESRARSRPATPPPTATPDKEEFVPATEGRAGPLGSQRAFLKSRSQKVDLSSKLGTVEIIDPRAAAAVGRGVTKCTDGVGWHCKVCDCFLKDSLTYLDHINGKKHQRYLGYSMRVERSTAEQVGELLRGLAQSDGKKEIGETDGPTEWQDILRIQQEEAWKRKADRARRREDRKRREREDNEPIDDDPFAPVQQNENLTADGCVPALQNDNEEDDDMDTHVAAIMGFSGFTRGKK